MAYALPRPTGFALLAPASRPQLDSARILTLSGTIALNLLAMGLLMLPLSLPAPIALPDDKPGIVIRDVFPDPPIVDIVPAKPPTPPTPVTQPAERRSTAPTASEPISAPAIGDTGTEAVPDAAAADTSGPVGDIATPSAGPSPMQLEYRLAPAPSYPRRALQQRLTGTVLLQVLVGIDGRPLAVKVAQSSGHRELDEAARTQVLTRWNFQPATREGVAVQAIGMVPIEFALRN
jgi:protein TonB